MQRVNATIVGGGDIGCAIAHELSKTLDNVILVEKNPRITQGENQSTRSSGVIHAGIYHDRRVSPLKARLCPYGNELAYEFFDEYGISYKRPGKLVIARKRDEINYLDDVLRIAIENGVPGVKKISAEEARELEPNIHCVSALYVPTSGIVDQVSLLSKLHHLAKDRGVQFLTGSKVVGIEPLNGRFVITLDSRERFETKLLINAAGLYSDVIGNMINPENNFEIEPVRGESAKFYCTRRPKINLRGLNVYPVPYGYDKKTGKKVEVPFAEFKELLAKGVIGRTTGAHLTHLLDEDGNVSSTVTIGPEKTVGVEKDNYGFAVSLEEFYSDAESFYSDPFSQDKPKLHPEDIELHQTGIMAVNKYNPDWIIERDRKYSNAIQLVGIDSPGQTSFLAIVEYVGDLIRRV